MLRRLTSELIVHTLQRPAQQQLCRFFKGGSMKDVPVVRVLTLTEATSIRPRTHPRARYATTHLKSVGGPIILLSTFLYRSSALLIPARPPLPAAPALPPLAAAPPLFALPPRPFAMTFSSNPSTAYGTPAYSHPPVGLGMEVYAGEFAHNRDCPMRREGVEAISVARSTKPEWTKWE